MINIRKNLPNFCIVVRQPLSGARTQQGSSEMEQIFGSGSSHPLKISPGFYDGEGHGPQPFLVFH